MDVAVAKCDAIRKYMMRQRIARRGTVRFHAIAHFRQCSNEMRVDFRRMMGHDEYSVLLSELRDTQRLGEARCPRRIELEIFNCPAFDEVTHCKSVDLALAMRKRNARFSCECNIIFRLQIPM